MCYKIKVIFNISAELIAYIGHVSKEPIVLLKHLGKVRRLPNDRPEAKILYSFTDHIDLKKQNPKETSHKPILLIDDDQEALLEEAQKLLKTYDVSGDDSSKVDESMKDFFRSLILVKPETEDHFFQKDGVTGILVWHLKRGEVPFPTHPTPDV